MIITIRLAIRRSLWTSEISSHISLIYKTPEDDTYDASNKANPVRSHYAEGFAKHPADPTEYRYAKEDNNLFHVLKLSAHIFKIVVQSYVNIEEA